MNDTTKKDGNADPAKENSAAEPAVDKTDKATIPAGKKEAPKNEKGMSGMKGPLMYVGPSIASIGIQNRVYTGIPAEVQELASRVPELKHLFIPVRRYPEAGRMLREGKGYIYRAYRKVAEMQGGGIGDGR